MRKLKNKINFKCEAKDNKLYLYGSVIDDESWPFEDLKENYICPKAVRKLIDEIKGDEIEVHISSLGGSVFGGITLHNMFKQCGKTVTAYVDGVCASAATFILMAASKIYMPENTQLLVHRASTYGWGNCKDLRAVADDLEHLDQTTLIPTYKARFTGEEEELEELLDKEEWLDAKKAKEYGFIDEIISIEKPETKETENTKADDKADEVEENKNIENRLVAFANAFKKFAEKTEKEN